MPHPQMPGRASNPGAGPGSRRVRSRWPFALLGAMLVLAACGTAGRRDLSSSSPRIGASPTTSTTAAGPPPTAAPVTTTSTAPDPAAGPQVVTIHLTPQGCAPSPASVSPGQVQFDVTNVDAPHTDEAEVWTTNWDEMMGEKEGLEPGYSARFSINLPTGSYLVNCPGGTRSEWPFNVT